MPLSDGKALLITTGRASYTPGDVNQDGNVVGVVTAVAAVEAFYKATGSLPQNVNWAVKGAYASLLLPPDIQRKKRSTKDPITNTKWSVVFIETD